MSENGKLRTPGTVYKILSIAIGVKISSYKNKKVAQRTVHSIFDVKPFGMTELVNSLPTYQNKTIAGEV